MDAILHSNSLYFLVLYRQYLQVPHSNQLDQNQDSYFLMHANVLYYNPFLEICKCLIEV